MINKENRKVPKRVLETLEQVRNSGLTNMFDRERVIIIAQSFNNWAGEWLMIYCGNYKRGYKLVSAYSNVLTQFTKYLEGKHD